MNAPKAEGLSPAQVREQARLLRAYAEHFVSDPWVYTRDLGNLVDIRRDHPSDRLPGRVRSSLRYLTARPDEWEKQLGVNRFRMAAHVLRRRRNLPDGVLDGGAVITMWEETGEYLQLVQPSVGSLLADLLEAHPELPHAQAIAAELLRITQTYEASLPAPSPSATPTHEES